MFWGQTPVFSFLQPISNSLSLYWINLQSHYDMDIAEDRLPDVP